MRTLQEKYNGINEGKFTKDQFLRDARMEQPNLVTRFNGYDDAVQILKNRGMIVETKSITEFSPYGSIAFSDKYKITDTAFNREYYNMYIGNEISQKEYDEIAKIGERDEVKGPDYEGGSSTELNEANQLKTTKKGLTDYRYKPTNDMDKYPYEQILRGLRVELEGLNVLGTPTPEEYKKALGKVLKNLEKDTIFYTNQVAGVSKKVDLHDKMIDVKKDNAVDKFNGLKKAALKEAIKGVIKNILSEGNEFGEVEGVYEMQEAKTDDDYRSELEAYLQDKQLEELDSAELFDILTDPDEEIVGDILWSYLEDYEKVEHYHNLMAIFRDYSNKDYSDWEKYQKNAHPGDRMDYEDWISTEGIDESVSLKDLL
jgi:uncharacterized protein YggL (DUF469 family)